MEGAVLIILPGTRWNMEFSALGLFIKVIGSVSRESSCKAGERLGFLAIALGFDENLNRRQSSGISPSWISHSFIHFADCLSGSNQLQTRGSGGGFVRPPPVELSGIAGSSASDKSSSVACWVMESSKPSHHGKVRSP